MKNWGIFTFKAGTTCKASARSRTFSLKGQYWCWGEKALCQVMWNQPCELLVAASCEADGPKIRKWRRAGQAKTNTHSDTYACKYTHSTPHTRAALSSICGEKHVFPSRWRSQTFSPKPQLFHSRPLRRRRRHLKKRIVSGKLTNALDTPGHMSGMKASFWNVTANAVPRESGRTLAHVAAAPCYDCKIHVSA